MSRTITTLKQLSRYRRDGYWTRRRVGVLVLVGAGLVAAIVLGQAAREPRLVRPGDSIAGMQLTRLAHPEANWQFKQANDAQVVASATRPSEMVLSEVWCGIPQGYDPQHPAPGTAALACTVPSERPLLIGPHWNARDDRHLMANWPLLNNQLFLDDQEVDLSQFGTFDADAGPWRRRQVAVVLENMQGTHTVRLITQLLQDVDDGHVLSPAGTYVTEITVTVIP